MTRIIVSIVQFIGGLVEAALFFRFIFKLFGANHAGLVGSLLDFTESLVKPFSFVPQISTASYTIDFSIITAMIAYAVIWYLLVDLVLLIGNSLSKR